MLPDGGLQRVVDRPQPQQIVHVALLVDPAAQEFGDERRLLGGVVLVGRVRRIAADSERTDSVATALGGILGSTW